MTTNFYIDGTMFKNIICHRVFATAAHSFDTGNDKNRATSINVESGFINVKIITF
jgi:hypothetical protein